MNQLPTVTEAETLGARARDEGNGPTESPTEWPRVLRQAFARGWGERGR